MNRIAQLLAGAVLVGGALFVGNWWGRHHAGSVAPVTPAAPAASPKALYWYDPMLPQEHYPGPGKSRMGMTLVAKFADAPAGERKPLYWYDPMVPAQHFAHPGKSPFMDMMLVPRYADEAGDAGVKIDPGARQNMGLRTAEVRRGRLSVAIRVPGTVGWDLAQERIVSARVDAVVAHLQVRTPFAKVAMGQPLAELTAPSWSSAMAEAAALRDARSDAGASLSTAANERLSTLGLPAGSRLRNGRVTLTAPITGVVSELGAREGQAAPAGTLLFRINGTATVWVEASVPQGASANIEVGTPAEVIVDSRPGQTFHGRVDALLPQVDLASRTQRARIVVENPRGELASGQFAQVIFHPSSGAEVPLVPSEALIGSGAQQRLILLGADDRFHPALVRIGRSSNGMTEILDGLQGGERVVVSGQFLLDSEANLSGELERLEAGAPASPAMDSPATEPRP